MLSTSNGVDVPEESGNQSFCVGATRAGIAKHCEQAIIDVCIPFLCEPFRAGGPALAFCGANIANSVGDPQAVWAAIPRRYRKAAQIPL